MSDYLTDDLRRWAKMEGDGFEPLDEGRSPYDRVVALLAAADTIDGLRAENAAWMNGVADVVEPFGFDRESACGPADLLPGLTTLVEQLAARCGIITNLSDANAALRAENARLLRKRDRSTIWAVEVFAARDATIESLRAALAPFAAEWDAEEPWTDTQSHCMFVPWGDVRRAAALLDAPDRFDEAVPVDEFIANVRAKMEGTDG
jgi:hypothetical protein